MPKDSNQRRERYIQAIFCGEDGGVGEAVLHLVMAVADAEQAELRAKVARVEALADEYDSVIPDSGAAQSIRDALRGRA